jgi:N-acetylmuramoyl-L-alanine amidase
MKISRHRLHQGASDPVPFLSTPNTGGALEPRYLVIHFTAGRSAKDSVAWLARRVAKASAHLVIGRDGKVTQLVPFDRVAWHAGASRWDGLVGLNRYSIGIELDNAGRLERKGEKWCAWFGDSYPDDEVMVATHKHESKPSGWHVYPPAQIDATLEAAQAIVEKYGVKDILGHEDISPGRKCDPGPAFPLGNFRSRLIGRAEDRPPLFRTTTALNIRTGPGTEHVTITVSPLPAETLLEVVDERGTWRLVNVLDAAGEASDVQGWVHGAFLRRVERDA